MKKHLIIAAMMPALFVGCSKDEKPNKPSQGNVANYLGKIFSDEQEQKVLQILSLDGKKLAGAQVLIGDKLGSPFNGNFLTADTEGRINVPAEWTKTETITIQAAGYLRATYLYQEPQNLEIKMRPIPSTTSYEVAGETQGHPVVDKDGMVDFGLVIPAMSKTDLLAFDMDAVISPQDDVISTLGQEIKVPSNVTLPRQKEKYSLFTATLDKPNYRVYFNQTGVNRVFAARGRFPFKSVVDQMRNGAKFPDLINEFGIYGGGIRDIEIKDAKAKLNIPIRELNFNVKKNVVAPQFAKNQIFMAVGVSESLGYLIPTDVKRVAAGKAMPLNTLPDNPSLVLGVLKNQNEMSSGTPGADRLSATVIPFADNTTPTMLPLMPNPSLNGPRILDIPQTSSIAGVNPIATYSLISQIEEKTVNGKPVKNLNRLWEIYGGGWQDRIVLPEWPNDKTVTGKKRWEVTLVGSQNSSLPVTGPAMIDSATHVTHSSLDF